MDDHDDCPKCKPGLPAWLATFADLMSLLMCFFVLLLSFSEMDVMKYKQVAGSMAFAFGVQNTIKMKDIPKGTSIIAQEFSPARPDPTPINEVRQTTTDVTKTDLQVNCPKGDTPADEAASSESDAFDSEALSEALSQLTVLAVKVEETAAEVASELSREVKSGQVEIETDGERIVIRVKEHGSFESGSASLRPSFIPVMARIRDVIKGIPGIYAVEGHSDNVPISTARFRSNWELSTSRAVSVLQELLVGNYIEERRLTAVGYGSVRPLVPNTTSVNRSKNRRVEIVIEQGKEPDWEEFKVSNSERVQKVADDIREAEKTIFDLDEDEIF